MSSDQSSKQTFNPLYKLIKGKTYGTSKTMIDSMAHKADELAKAEKAKSVKDYKGREIKPDRILVITKSNLIEGKLGDSDYQNVIFIKNENDQGFTEIGSNVLKDVTRAPGSYYVAISGSHFVLVKKDPTINIEKHYVINVSKSITIPEISKTLIAERFEKGVVSKLSSPNGTIALKAKAFATVLSEELKKLITFIIETFKNGNAKNKRKMLVSSGVQEDSANLISGMYGYLVNAFCSIFGMSGAIGNAVIMPFIYCAIKDDWSLLKRFSIMTRMCDEHWSLLRFDVPESYLKKSNAYRELVVAVNQKGMWAAASPDFNYDALYDYLVGDDNGDPTWIQCQEVYNHWKGRFDKLSLDLVGKGKAGYYVIEGGYAFSVPDNLKGNKSVYHLGTVGINLDGIIIGKVDKTSATQYLNSDLLKDLDDTPAKELRSLYNKKSSKTYPFLNALYSSSKDFDYFKELSEQEPDEFYVKVVKNLLVNEAKGVLSSDIFDYFDDEWSGIFEKAYAQLKNPLCGIIADVIIFQTVADHDKMEDKEVKDKRDALFTKLCGQYDAETFDVSSLLPHLKVLIGDNKNGDVGEGSLLMCKDFTP